ncbi:hypothetical protein [Novosphingobium resinovorum]|uniref:Uncharacterized protein n=1 Tax=Novosphingobium resinovorum TaxID=158500 RepID=A0A1D8A323_9SPHN|nr:hypothetical protein [Novosphingobium resinovorum]AOR76518.1 hypothetical protein BES08_07005 [Novosphingobium resinovorum]
MSTPAAAPLTIDALFSSIIALTAALNRTADNQERLIAGQQAAIEKIEGAKTTTTRARKPKDDAPAATTTATEKAPEVEAVKSFLPDIKTGDGDALKAHIQPWLGAVAKGTPEAAERVGFLKAIAEHFGVEAKFGPLAEGDDRLKQTLFYFERKKAGKPVDFKVDYDFDGDPEQEAEAPAGDDDFG